MKEYNVYCDETCHLEHDYSPIMALGGIWCEKKEIKQITEDIYAIKEKHGYSKYMEMKWTKICNSNKDFYKDIVEYFFANKKLRFRGYLADKTSLNHRNFNQTHDEWYYKIYFRMLEYIFIKNNKYNVYIDIKDHHSYTKCQKLHKISCKKIKDYSCKTIKKIQPIRSYESQLIQITDILIGAICHYNRFGTKSMSEAKKEIIALIEKRSDSNLLTNSYLSNRKFNLFFWSSRNG